MRKHVFSFASMKDYHQYLNAHPDLSQGDVAPEHQEGGNPPDYFVAEFFSDKELTEQEQDDKGFPGVIVATYNIEQEL